ncbi:MAG: NADH:ubiquinone reductase (Na(+)-transporting) subunit D, partial [Gammaproteobacteria bacterium]|nr:NADH:ubiquinone reductase (Na(+)-transporting) subunit D [Gammaproteobacteria bacterium]
MSDVSVKKVLFEPIFNNNPIALQILGICSALAVTSSMSVTLVMCVALTLVTAFSSMSVSMIRLRSALTGGLLVLVLVA